MPRGLLSPLTIVDSLDASIPALLMMELPKSVYAVQHIVLQTVVKYC